MAAEVTSAIAAFADVEAAIPVIGAAFLGALALLAVWKLVRGGFA